MAQVQQQTAAIYGYGSPCLTAPMADAGPTSAPIQTAPAPDNDRVCMQMLSQEMTAVPDRDVNSVTSDAARQSHMRCKTRGPQISLRILLSSRVMLTELS